MLFRNPIPTRSVILRKDLPYRFGEKMHAEDYLLWLHLAYNGKNLWKLPMPLAFAFRPDFSAEGFSGSLLKHELCELRVYKSLYQADLISLRLCLFAGLFSVLKFFRRCLIVLKRQMDNHLKS